MIAKLQQAIAGRGRETSGQRRKRIAKYERERQQNEAPLREMVDAFSFRLAGEETVRGRRCFVLDGAPKPGYHPSSRETKALTGMRGRLWIDEQQFQWVRVQAEVFRPVPFGLFIAKVEPGTQFFLEQEPVNGTLWLPSHFSMRAAAKVLRVWSHNTTEKKTYSDYRLASRDQAALRR